MATGPGGKAPVLEEPERVQDWQWIRPDEFGPGLRRYLLVRFPCDWPEDEKYDFRAEWNKVQFAADPFVNYPYP